MSRDSKLYVVTMFMAAFDKEEVYRLTQHINEDKLDSVLDEMAEYIRSLTRGSAIKKKEEVLVELLECLTEGV